MLVTLMAFKQMSIILVAFVYKYVRYNTLTHTQPYYYYFDITHYIQCTVYAGWPWHRGKQTTSFAFIIERHNQ